MDKPGSYRITTPLARWYEGSSPSTGPIRFRPCELWRGDGYPDGETIDLCEATVLTEIDPDVAKITQVPSMANPNDPHQYDLMFEFGRREISVERKQLIGWRVLETLVVRDPDQRPR